MGSLKIQWLQLVPESSRNPGLGSPRCGWMTYQLGTPVRTIKGGMSA